MVDALGVLPGKGDEAPFDDKARKALQKTLQRLKSEEGNLTKNGQQAAQEISYLVAGYLPPPWSLALGEALFDAHDAFRIHVYEEGTVLNRCESLRYVISQVWGPASVVHLARRILQFDLLGADSPVPEDQLWFLPDLDGEKPVWPLARALAWAYRRAGVSQTQFHYPGRDAGESDSQRQRDLENAQNWSAGHSLPSAATLAATFSRAFDAWSDPDQPDTYRLPGISSRLERDGVLGVLFMARVATFLGQALLRTFGRAFLEKQRTRIARSWVRAVAEMKAMREHMAREARELRLPEADLPELRLMRAKEWGEHLAIRSRRALDVLRQTDTCDSSDAAVIEALEKELSPLPVSLALSCLPDDDYPQMSLTIAQALGEGLHLEQDPTLTAALIDRYEAKICALGVIEALPWIVPWLRFLESYRRATDPREAWKWVQLAWQNGRNCAGRRSEQITAHYIEMAAVVQSNVALRTAARWAHYRGLSIFGLETEEPTREYLAELTSLLRRQTRVGTFPKEAFT